MHLRDADAPRDGVLRELLAEPQQDDLGILRAQDPEQRDEQGAVLSARVAIVVATAAVLLRPFAVIRPWPVERDRVARDGDLQGLEDQLLAGAQAL